MEFLTAKSEEPWTTGDHSGADVLYGWFPRYSHLDPAGLVDVCQPLVDALEVVLVLLGLVEDSRQARGHLPLQPPQLIRAHLGHARVPNHLGGAQFNRKLVFDSCPNHMRHQVG